MPRHSHTPEELELLTEEELAGLEDDEVIDEGEESADDDTDTDAEPEKVDAPAADDDDEPEEPSVPAKADAPQPTPATPAKADAPVADAPKPEATAPAPVPAPASFPQYEAPPNAKERLAEIERQRDELAKKFDEGELTASEHRAQDRALENERDGLKEQLFRASLSQDATVQTWSQSTVPSFLKDHPQYTPGSTAYSSLDAEVRRIQSESDNPFDPAILKTAHANIMAQARAFLGIKEEKPAPKTPADPKAKKREIPPSLADLPAAEPADLTDGSEFAYIDRLQGTAYEEALAKLTPEQQERYLSQ